MTTPPSEPMRAPAAARNRDPILAVLRETMPSRGTVLEIASGTGEHAVHCAAALPHLTWQPSDVDEGALASIAAHSALAGLPNVLPPVELDVTLWPWPVVQADAIVCINMLHIAPWDAALALVAGSERVLAPGGVLYLYGPFRENGAHTAPSNAAFDASLRARNPEWGVRDLGEVTELAQKHGLDSAARVPMPANNLSVVFRRSGSSKKEGA
jgi:SAM-dependent methyltransferase